MDRSGADGRRSRVWLIGRGAFLTAVVTVSCLIGLSVTALAGPINYRKADQILVNHFVSLESGLLHITPVAPVTVVEVNGRVYGDINGKTVPAYVVTQPMGAPGDPKGPVKSCTIRVGTDAHAAAVDPTRPPGPHNPPSKDLGYINEELKTFFAHEVFHCLSAKLAGTIANFDHHKAWLIEGAATWVESDLVADSLLPRDAWLAYLESPVKPLFEREEDAIGFFGHLAHSGISPWKVFPHMFAATTDTAAYNAAVGSDMRFLDSEASAFFDAGGFGSAWVPRGQGNATADSNVPQHSTSLPTKGPRAHATSTLVVAPYADAPDRLTVQAPITELAVLSGEVRLHSTVGGGADLINPGALTLCQTGRHCDCPGQHVTFGTGDLAITGGPTGATVKLVGLRDCPAIPARSCVGLLSQRDFPGATSEVSQEIRPVSICAFGRAEPKKGPPPPPPPDSAGGLTVETYGNATMAHQYFQLQRAHCQGCGALSGVGDEAFGAAFTAEEDIGYFNTGRISFARIDNVIVSVSILPAHGDPTLPLLRHVIGELLATLK